MYIQKEIKHDNELYVYFNGKLIYKRWLDLGYGKVFDKHAFGKYTDCSITDFDLSKTAEFIKVKASLKLISTENGGRESGISSGFRPNNVFEYQSNGQFEFAFVGDIQLNQDDLMMPGETKEVTVRFLTNQPLDKYLNIGRKWYIYEGARQIGEAEMLEINL